MKIIKAVVGAGGYSSRFYPYSKSRHKTMLKIMGKPILQYCLEGLKEAGIREIILRVNTDGIIKKYFGDGSKFGLSIKYIEQKEALGVGDILLKAEKFLNGDFIFINGNHFNSKDLVRELIKKRDKTAKGAILVKKRKNPWDYGVVEIKEGKLIRIVEKPQKGTEPSDLGLVGVMLLPLQIIDVIKKVEIYEFNLEEKVLAEYAKENFIDVIEAQVETTTLKYVWDILSLKNMLMKRIVGKVNKNAKVSKHAQVDKNVVIEEGAQILEGAKIKGPAYIGKNVRVGTDVLVRNGSDLEEGVSVGAFTEVKNSLLMEGTTIHSGFFGDSIIGSNCKIGSHFTTANRRIDRGHIEVSVKDRKVDTGLTSFGAIIGDNVKTGIKVSTMPGVIIGNNVLIGPSTSVFKNIDDDVKYYTKFAEVIEKK